MRSLLRRPRKIFQSSGSAGGTTKTDMSIAQVEEALVVSVTVVELSGQSFDLGTFEPQNEVCEIFVRTSEAMCVPTETVRLVVENSTTPLTNCKAPIGRMFGSTARLAVMLQIPPGVLQDLTANFKMRMRAFAKLGQLACGRPGATSRITLRLCKSIVMVVTEGLFENCNILVRESAIGALSKILKYSIGLLESGAQDMLQSVRDIISDLVQVFGRLSLSAEWTERQQACKELGELGVVGFISETEAQRLCECCRDGNPAVQIEALKSIAQALENGIRVSSQQANCIADIFIRGLWDASPAINEYSCRGLGCVATAGALRDVMPEQALRDRLADCAVDFTTRRAANRALAQMAGAGM